MSERTEVTFDNAHLADAVAKAKQIAPTKGSAFDKAAGIMVEVRPAQRTATVRSTDLEVSYEQNIPLLEGSGADAKWRIPSSILHGIITNLPMGDGATIDFIDRGDPSAIRFKSGNMVARIDVLNALEFPRIPTFDTDGMSPAQELSVKIEQVGWAVDPKSPVLSGVHIDGERLIGCDRHVLAFVDCKVDVTEPITVPLSAITSILKSSSDVHVRAVGKQFQIMLDAETKVTCPVLEGNYPKINDSIARLNFTDTVKIHKAQFVDTLERMMVMTQNDKSPTLSLEFNAEGMIKMLTFGMEIPKTGRMQDAIDIDAEDFEGVFKIFFNPQKLLDAVRQAKADFFMFSFGHENAEKAPLMQCRITTEAGYTCYVMPKQKG